MLSISCKHFYRLLPAIFLLLLMPGCSRRETHQPLTGHNDSLINLLARNDPALPPPAPDDWRSHHPEPGQTFHQYLEADFASPGSLRKIIYLQPIGNFTTEEQQLLEATRDYLSRFFCLETRISAAFTETLIPASARRINAYSGTQFFAPFLLDTLLPPRRPADAIVVMAVTTKDLYPAASWNYVFGMASYRKLTGVSSCYRYLHPSTDSTLALRRFIQTSAHEICHMFSMLHCIHAPCLMNGSNSLEESDRQPDKLCAECLHKLQYNLKFDVEKRLRSIDTFFRQHGLMQPAQQTARDLRLIGLLTPA